MPVDDKNEVQVSTGFLVFAAVAMIMFLGVLLFVLTLAPGEGFFAGDAADDSAEKEDGISSTAERRSFHGDGEEGTAGPCRRPDNRPGDDNEAVDGFPIGIDDFPGVPDEEEIGIIIRGGEDDGEFEWVVAEPACTAYGCVLDNIGLPVADAEVRLVVDLETYRVRAAKTRTDSSGAFEFGVIPGKYRLVVDSPLYEKYLGEPFTLVEGASQFFPVTLSGETRPFTFRVVDDYSNAPVAGARISLYGRRKESSLVTDASGACAAQIGSWDYVIICIAQGYETKGTTGERIGLFGIRDGTFVVRMKPITSALEGTVRDAGTGETLEYATVRVIELDRKTENNLYTNNFGEFSAAVSPGAYLIVAEKNGYRDWTPGEILIGQTDRRLFDIRLKPVKNNAKISGSVFSAVTGRKMVRRTAVVSLELADYEPYTFFFGQEQTLVGGDFEFAAYPGDYILYCELAGYLNFRIPVTLTANAAREVHIIMSPVPELDSRVAGAVTDANGSPVAGALVEAFFGDTITDEVETDAEGRFELKVPAGEVVLEVSKSWRHQLSDYLAEGKAELTIEEQEKREVKIAVRTWML